MLSGTKSLGGASLLAVAQFLVLLGCLVHGLSIHQAAAGEDESPMLPPAEYGHGLEPQQALDGWISLFDGASTFGWVDSAVRGERLVGGRSTSRFGDYALRARFARAGTIRLGGRAYEAPAGLLELEHRGPAGAIVLDGQTQLGALAIRPLGLQGLFNGRDMTGWHEIRRSSPADWSVWRVQQGTLAARGGPSALEYKAEQFGDCVVQARIRTLAPQSNGGLFFRSQPGLFMMGYEAQVYNRCLGNDPARPARYSTGALDDRQMARRLVSRDGQTFVLTVVADGPHIATWVNGYQMTDWTDDRPPHENPREGLRTEAGTIQLQAHDPDTDLAVEQVAVARLTE